MTLYALTRTPSGQNTNGLMAYNKYEANVVKSVKLISLNGNRSFSFTVNGTSCAVGSSVNVDGAETTVQFNYSGGGYNDYCTAVYEVTLL